MPLRERYTLLVQLVVSGPRTVWQSLMLQPGGMPFLVRSRACITDVPPGIWGQWQLESTWVFHPLPWMKWVLYSIPPKKIIYGNHVMTRFIIECVEFLILICIEVICSKLPRVLLVQLKPGINQRQLGSLEWRVSSDNDCIRWFPVESLKFRPWLTIEKCKVITDLLGSSRNPLYTTDFSGNLNH